MAESVIRLKRQLRYQGTILKIYEDTVLANGHEAHWDFIHHDGAAAVLPVTDDGKILMVRQYRNALDRQTLEIPAGKLDAPNEPKIECAFRELEEETGFKTENMEYLMSVNTTVAFCDEAIDIFAEENEEFCLEFFKVIKFALGNLVPDIEDSKNKCKTDCPFFTSEHRELCKALCNQQNCYQCVVKSYEILKSNYNNIEKCSNEYLARMEEAEYENIRLKAQIWDLQHKEFQPQS